MSAWEKGRDRDFLECVFSLGSSAKSNAYPPIDMVCVLLVCGPVKTQMIEEVKVTSALPSV